MSETTEKQPAKLHALLAVEGDLAGQSRRILEETRKTFDGLINRGQKFEKNEKNVVSKTIDEATTKAKDFGTKVEDTVHDTVTTVLHRAGVPSRDEIRTLIDRVEELNKKVEKLQVN